MWPSALALVIMTRDANGVKFGNEIISQSPLSTYKVIFTLLNIGRCEASKRGD